MFKPRLGVHLHLKQHHWVLRGAGLAAFGPKGPIKTMVSCFELRRVKSIERIARRIRPERGKRRRTLRQQQGDQIRRALEQPVEPVIGFQSPSLRTEQPSDTGQPSASRSHHSTPVLLRGVSTVPRACDQAPAVGMLLRPRPPPGGHRHTEGSNPPATHNPQPTTAAPRREPQPHPPPPGRRRADALVMIQQQVASAQPADAQNHQLA